MGFGTNGDVDVDRTVDGANGTNTSVVPTNGGSVAVRCVGNSITKRVGRDDVGATTETTTRDGGSIAIGGVGASAAAVSVSVPQ